jgi:hypothetical protein
VSTDTIAPVGPVRTPTQSSVPDDSHPRNARRAPRATKRPPKGAPRPSTASPRYSGMQRRPNIGLRLRALREEAGLTQEELARLTTNTWVDPEGRGVGYYTIGRQENNEHVPKRHTIELLARALTFRLGRTITPSMLMSGGDEGGLAAYLERDRQRRGQTVPAFAELLGIPPERYRQAVKRHDWTPSELGRVVRLLPETSPLIAEAIAQQAP